MVNSDTTRRRLASVVPQPFSDNEMHTRAPNGLGGHDGAIWSARYILGGALPVGIIVQQVTTGRKRPKTGLYFEKSTFGACAAPGVSSSKYGRGPFPRSFAVSTCGKRRM